MNGALDGRTVTAVASFDSFAKTGMAMLAKCRQSGARTNLILLELSGRMLSRRQRLEVQRVDPKTKMLRHSWEDSRRICKQLLSDVDAVLICLDGQRSRDLLLQLQQLRTDEQPSPVLVSAYPGILFRYQLEGMLDRSGSDLLCLNSEQDLKTYQLGCKALGLDSKNAEHTGLPILWDLRARQHTPIRGTFVFFEQPSIPVHPLQRRFLCKQLQHLAKAWPDHTVIFKPRTSSVESTLHRRHGEMGELIKKLSKETRNLEVSFRPASILLKDCACAITVSSTAALEAMAMGVSTRIVADLGLNESLGNHYFAASGAVASFDQIIKNPFTPCHDNEWLSRAGWKPDGAERFITSLSTRLNLGQTQLCSQQCGSQGWGSQAWREFAVAHGGRRMLSTGGGLSSRKKRHHGVKLARSIREKLVGLWGVEQWIKG